MAAYTYTYRVQGLQKAPAEVTGAICEQLQNSAKGLTPKTLLEASRDEDAPLHDEFEWNDSTAAERYRLQQARAIIQNVMITCVSEKAEPSDRAFVITPGYKSQYVALDSALNNVDWRLHLLDQAKGEARSFIQKYRRLNELSGIVKTMEQVLQELS